MARLFSSGFELNTTSGHVEWDDITGATIQTTTVRSGTYALRSNPTAAVNYAATRVSASNQSKGLFVRAYLRIATNPAAQCKILTVANSSVQDKIGLRLNTDGTLELWNEEDAAQIGSDSSALSTNTWYRIELKVDTTSLSATAVNAQIDGTSFASGTANLANGWMWVTVGTNAVSTRDTYFDDVAINDDTGSYQNTYPGDGAIVHLRPSGTGDSGTWTNTFTSIDEVTPNDNTDRIEDNTLNDIEDVNIDNTPAAIATGDTINVVQVGVRYNKESSASSVAFVLRLKGSAGGTTDESSAIAPDGTTWHTNANAAPFNYPVIGNSSNYEVPGTNNPWTKADLDTTQIGVRISTDGAGTNVKVSTLWLLVESSAVTTLSVNVSDSIAVSESEVTCLVDVPIVSDSISVTENVVTNIVLPPNISDTITVSENVVASNPTLPINVSDSISIAENIQQMGIPNPSVSDSIAITETTIVNLLAAGQIAIVVSEAITVSENTVVTDANPQIVVADTIAVAENAVVYREVLIPVSDSISVAESVNTTVSTSQINVSDSITVNESILLLLLCFINVSDTITVLEETTQDLEILVNVSEAISVAEQVSISNNLDEVTVSDSISVAESVVMDLTTKIAISESIIVSESNNASVSDLPAAVSDSILVTESTKEDLELKINVSDAITVTEAVVISLFNSPYVSDTVLVTDQVTDIIRGNIRDINVSESISVSENVVGDAGFGINLSDAISVAESTQASVSDPQISVADSIAVNENIVLETINFINVSDSITLTESNQEVLESFINVSDSISVTESVLILLILGPIISDAIAIVESNNIVLSDAPLNVSDTITVSESIDTFTDIRHISVSDTVTVSESVSGSPAINVNVSDNVSLTESAPSFQMGSLEFKTYVFIEDELYIHLVGNVYTRA